MITKAALYVLWFFVWLFLTWPPSRADLITALVVSFIVCVMTFDTLGQTYGTDYTPATKRGSFFANILRPFWFVWYLVVFVFECLRANIDVAYRVLHPDMPIRPGTIRVKVRLKSDIGLTFLANSITLTPGTTSVDIDKKNGYLYVHWLYVRDGYESGEKPLPVVVKFENILEKVFE